MFGFLPGPSLCCGKAAATYRMHFCGLCNGLHRDYGLWARWLINRDSTFLALLGSALAPQSPATCRTTCCNPWATPHELLHASPSLHYAAAVTICGLTTKLDDDSEDERGTRRWLAQVSRHALGAASSKALGVLHGLHFPVTSILQTLHSQSTTEQHGADLLQAAHSTRSAYGEIVAHTAHFDGGSSLATSLREIGQQLGFLIYTKDAWDDWSSDRRRGRYNPLSSLVSAEERRAFLSPFLENALAAMKQAFAALPLHRHRDLLSQVLLEGAESRVNDILGSPGKLDYLTRLKSRDSSSEKKKTKNDCCSSCDCCEGCCHCPCHRSTSGKFCDCNPCDGDGCDCCGCDCGCG